MPLSPTLKQDNTLLLKDDRKMKYEGICFFLSNTDHIFSGTCVLFDNTLTGFALLTTLCEHLVCVNLQFMRLFFLKILFNILDY